MPIRLRLRSCSVSFCPALPGPALSGPALLGLALLGLALLGLALAPPPVFAQAASGHSSRATMVARPAEPPVLLAPVRPACISSPFGPRILPGRPLAGTFHYGIDLPAPLGAPVLAVAPGTLIRVQRHGIGGLEMLIQHNGFIGIYSHLGLVAPALAEGGRTVYGGERIGTVGHTGLTYGPHLYFGMIMNGQPVDPAPILKVASCGGAASTPADTRLRPTRIYAVR